MYILHLFYSYLSIFTSIYYIYIHYKCIQYVAGLLKKFVCLRKTSNVLQRRIIVIGNIIIQMIFSSN